MPSHPNFRLNGLDSLRTLLVAAGLFCHAAVSYLAGDRWAYFIRDPNQSAILCVLVYVINISLFPSFFLIAGFCGREGLQRLGSKAFALDRAKRIGRPLLFAYPFLLVGTLVPTMIGTYITYRGALPAQLPPPDPNAPVPVGFPLLSLWFLYLLMLFYAAFIAAHIVSRKIGIGDYISRLSSACIDKLTYTYMLPVTLGAPLAWALASQSHWAMWLGVPPPALGLVPNLPSLIAYGGAFTLGWLFHLRRSALGTLLRQWPIYLAFAGLATAFCLAIVGIEASAWSPGPDELVRSSKHWLYASVYAVAIWSSVLGIVGICIDRMSFESRFSRYISDASYWVFLSHLPITMMLQIFSSQIYFWWPAKLAAVLAVDAIIIFGAYHLLVRRSWIGRLLNGKISGQRLDDLAMGAGKYRGDSAPMRFPPNATNVVPLRRN